MAGCARIGRLGLRWAPAPAEPTITAGWAVSRVARAAADQTMTTASRGACANSRDRAGRPGRRRPYADLGEPVGNGVLGQLAVGELAQPSSMTASQCSIWRRVAIDIARQKGR
jgi:hypothetical protein